MLTTKPIRLAVAKQSALDTITWQVVQGKSLLILPISTNRELDEAAIWLEEWTFEVNQLLPPLLAESMVELAQDFLVHHESLFATAQTLRNKQNEFRKQVQRRVKALVEIHNKINLEIC